MPIIFSTIAPASPECPPPARVYFEAPDDALLARVTEKVASILGRHQAYAFHEPSEVPAGLVPVVLSHAEVCFELALDTGRTQEAPRRAFWRLWDRAIKVPERPVGEADYSSLELLVLARNLRNATDKPLAAYCQAPIDAGGEHTLRASHGQAPAWATKPTEQRILEAAFAPAPPAAEASRFGSPELQAMIIARCLAKDQADSVPAPAGGIPGNFITHWAAWRKALEIAKTHATGDDATYWAHELRAFDRSFDRLLALMQAPTPPAQVADSAEPAATQPAPQQEVPDNHHQCRLLTRAELDALCAKAEGMDGNQWDMWVQEQFARANRLKIEGSNYD